ncbi:Ig-like domain-containing protein, partial [Candidatus Borrarchaeum sp.]|uniref:Ig-like domain-containing protein n=1 Tax=Candidatus Borrarchaeum sp. TaxID=2846742 RepID=UPI00257BC7E7
MITLLQMDPSHLEKGSYWLTKYLLIYLLPSSFSLSPSIMKMLTYFPILSLACWIIAPFVVTGFLHSFNHSFQRFSLKHRKKMRFTKLRILTLSLVLLLSGMAIFVVVSGMPPQVNVYNPQNNQSVSGTVEIEAEVESRHPLCYVKVSFDEGVSWNLMEQQDGDDYFGTYIFTWNTKSLSDGDQKILVKTLDTFGRSDYCTVNVKVSNSNNSYLLYSGILDVASSVSQFSVDTQDTQSSAQNSTDENDVPSIELEWVEPLNNSFQYNTFWINIDCKDPDSIMDTIWYRVVNETKGSQGSIVIDNMILASPTYTIELNVSSWKDGSLYRIEGFGNTTTGITYALSDEEAIFFSIDILQASFSHNPATQRVPNVPIPDEDIQINATISNNLDIDTVILVYSINGDWTEHNDSTVMTSYFGDNIYSGTIPGQDTKVYIEYYFYYNTTLGAHAVNDNIGQYYSFIVDPVNIDYISPPENNSWVSGIQTFDWDISTTDGFLDHYVVYRNETVIEEADFSGSLTTTSISIINDTTNPLFSNGDCYNFTIWANNTNGAWNVSSVFVYVDNETPNLVFVQSTAYMNSTEIDYGVTRALNISVQATDGISSIDTIFISHNASGTWQNYTMPINGTTNFYFNITDVSSLSLGNVFMWLFYANDTAGVWQIQDNGGANYSIVVVDLSGPNLIHINDTNYLNDTAPQTSDNIVRFNATVSDNVGVESVFLCANATGSFTNYKATQDGVTTTWFVDLDVSALSAGEIIQYYWFANDTNAANPARFDNVGLYWWFGYFVDDESPQLIHANDSNYLNDSTPQTSDSAVRFNATVTDNEGVESVLLCANVTGSFANYTAIQDGATTTWYVDLDVSSVLAGEIIQYYWYANDTNVANPTRFDNLGLYWWFGYFIDDEPPVITHNQIADVNDSILTTSDETVRINATVTDNENVISVFLCENST